MGVYSLTDDASVFTANVYLLTGERTVLVDAGAMPGIEQAVAAHVDHLDAVILTHQHGDHVAELEAILDRFAPACYAFAEHPHRTDSLADGDTIEMGNDRYEVVHTPGHATDHVCLLGEKRLFSGDVVVYSDGAFEHGSFGRTDMAGQDRQTLINSLDRLLERLPATVSEFYPGHGPTYIADAADSVATIIRRARERAARFEPKYPED